MLAQNVNATKQKRKPPAGLDTHMLGRRLAAATGVGKRGADGKASTSSFHLLVNALLQEQGSPLWSLEDLMAVQASTSAVQRAGINRSFTGMGSRGSSTGKLPMSRTASGSVLDHRQDQDAGTVNALKRSLRKELCALLVFHPRWRSARSLPLLLLLLMQIRGNVCALYWTPPAEQVSCLVMKSWGRSNAH